MDGFYHRFSLKWFSLEKKIIFLKVFEIRSWVDFSSKIWSNSRFCWNIDAMSFWPTSRGIQSSRCKHLFCFLYKALLPEIAEKVRFLNSSYFRIVLRATNSVAKCLPCMQQSYFNGFSEKMHISTKCVKNGFGFLLVQNKRIKVSSCNFLWVCLNESRNFKENFVGFL